MNLRVLPDCLTRMSCSVCSFVVNVRSFGISKISSVKKINGFFTFASEVITLWWDRNIIICPHHMHAVHRCDLLLQMSHVAWSVCLSVSVHWKYFDIRQLKTSNRNCNFELCKNGWTDRDAVLGNWLVGPRNHGGPDPPREGALLRETSRPIVTYLSVLNVPVQRTRRMNALVTARADMTRQRCGLLPNYVHLTLVTDSTYPAKYLENYNLLNK